MLLKANKITQTGSGNIYKDYERKKTIKNAISISPVLDSLGKKKAIEIETQSRSYSYLSSKIIDMEII